ncbi:MAG: biotin transporter BioY [Lachnospiraceae bacterium]|nr:biotin transporter BioY [Lachnospiraceae bacterium]
MKIQKEEPHRKNGNRYSKTYDMAYIAIFVVLIIICSWITIPLGTIPVTMQTFAIFLTVGVLGGRRGSMALLIYLLIGAIGLPVFSGFQAGPGVLLGQTGGYLLGFVLAVLLMWLLEVILGRKGWVQILGMLLGLVLCYGFGTAWFMLIYTRSTGVIGVGTVLALCVVPFVLPDLVKIALAYVLTRRLIKVLPVS